MDKYIFDTDFSLRDPLILTDETFWMRWSPRSFKNKPVDEEILKSIIDAARWTMSCFNEQPWLIVTSSKNSLAKHLELLNENNRDWAKDAPVIGFIFAGKTFSHNGKENKWARFDCGAAWMAMTLQANMHGLFTHGMAGFDRDRSNEVLSIPENYEPVIAFALGYRDTPDQLDERNRTREKPSPRKPLNKIWKIT